MIMTIFEVKSVRYRESYLHTSARELTLYLRCHSQKSRKVLLAYIVYTIGCFAIAILSLEFPLLLPILGLLVCLGVFLRYQTKRAKTPYEVWKFDQKQLRIFKFKAPRKSLTPLQLTPYLTQASLAQKVNTSDVENVQVEEYCDESGYQYSCRLNIAQSIVQIGLSYRDAYRLANEVNHWLTLKA